MRNVLAIGFVLMFLVGCAAIKQAREDVTLGMSAPLSEGETHPKDAGKQFGQLFANAPYGSGVVLVPLLGSLFGYYKAWKRGKNIRLGRPASTKPITGALGDSLKIEGVVQHLADIRAGVLDVGAPGGEGRRSWKMIVLFALASGLYSVIDPITQIVVANPPAWMNTAMLGVVLAGFAAVEKWLGKVLVVKNAEPAK